MKYSTLLNYVCIKV